MQHVRIAGFIENGLGQIGMAHAIIMAIAPKIDLVDKFGQPALAGAFNLIRLQHHGRQREQGPAIIAGIALQLLHSRIADSALWLIDHAIKR